MIQNTFYYYEYALGFKVNSKAWMTGASINTH